MYQVEDEPMETIHLYVVREGEKRPSLIPIILSIVVLSLLIAVGTLVPYQQPEQRASIRVPAVLLPLTVFTTTVAVTPTGVQIFPATRASGVLSITNGSILAQHVPAGMMVTGSNGVAVVTTESVDVPAGNGTTYGIAYVTAQAVTLGAKGNIPAFALQVVYGTSLFLKNERDFTGGKDAYHIPMMTPQDRQSALAKARGTLLRQTLSGLLYHPCLEHATGTTSLHVAWTCQFFTYSVPSLLHVRVLHMQVIGRGVLLNITYVPRPHHLETK
ncbi:MAG: baseplate J/gp47 family protein [Ktedonobacteraceae bacterium]